MFSNHYKTPLLLASLILAFYILLHYVFAINLAIHSLIDIFAGGRSEIKVEIFFGFALLLCLLTMIAQRVWAERIRIKNSVLLSTIGLTFAYNLFLLFLFFQKLGFGLRDFVITFNNGEISSTTLLHNHVLKGFNALILKFFGLAVNENVDTGYAFVGLIHSAWLWIGGLLVLSCAILLIIKFLELYQDREQNNRRWQGLFIFLFAIISFSLLKNMLDGGIMNRETPIALGGLIYLLLSNSDADGQSRFKTALWSLSPIFLFILGGVLSWRIFESYLILIGVYIGVLVVLLFWYRTGLVSRLAVLLAVFGGLLLVIPLSQAFQTYQYSKQQIPTEGAYVGLYHDPVPASSDYWSLQEKIHDLDIYKFTLKKGEPTSLTVQDLTTSNHLLTSLEPIKIPWNNCVPVFPYNEIDFTLATPQHLELDPKQYQFGYIAKVKELGQVKGLNHYQITIGVNPCAVRILNITEELLKQRGLTTFYILNISDPNVAI